MTLEKELNM